MLLKEKNSYAEKWLSEKTVADYEKKFQSKIDSLRHSVEAKIIKKYAHGRLFDCSIGTGRFVPELEKIVENYQAMDYSPLFLNFIKIKYPEIKTVQADLEEKIPFPNNVFDTVICLRTLPALKNFSKIFPEMQRIAKPNGTIIFDISQQQAKEFEKTLPGLPVKKQKAFLLDGFFHLIKNTRYFPLIFNSKYNILPRKIWLFMEKISLLFSHQRKLYILTKL